MKNVKTINLLDFMANACYYAQSHCGDPEAWEGVDRDYLLQCTSYQMACFLAQNTVEGCNGVEWEIVMDDLGDDTLDEDGMMCKSVDEWKKILGGLVEELGGWK